MNILDISGKPVMRLGGEFTHKQHIKGDIVIEFTWNPANGEPVMLLYAAVPQTKVGTYMIELGDAHEYAMSTGYGSAKLKELCQGACEAMGFHMDKFAVFRTMDAILEFLPDLLKMPPEPPASEDANKPHVTGDSMTLTDRKTGKVIAEIQV